jgi:hypothetical protein
MARPVLVLFLLLIFKDTILSLVCQLELGSEGIQSDVFDHLLSIVPEFGLRLYQKPAGSDLASLKTV